jgi:hypothetical protein
MIGEVNRGVEALIHTNLRKPIQARVQLHMGLKKPKNGDSAATNPNILNTDGLYRLRYCPSSQRAYKEKPFIFRADFLVKEAIHLKDWEDYQNLVKSDERVAFINKYININENHFKIAKENVLINLYFGFDIERYIKDVAENEGNEIDYSILRTPEMNEVEKEKFKVFLNINSIRDVEV